MHFPKRNYLWTILLLSITIVAASLTTETAVIQHETPFWEFVLREFIFKTISPSETRSNDGIHKKILEAPFYGRPLPKTSDEQNALLSRGNVYRMKDGQWILCEEDCINCALCRHQEQPIVKWTLRRLKRATNGGLPKSDLQLTVVRQENERFRSGKYLWPYNYDVYVTSQRQSKAKGAKEPSISSTEKTFSLENSREKHSRDRNVAEQQLVALIQESDFVSPETQGNSHSFVDSDVRKQQAGHSRENLPVSRIRSERLPRVKRYRSKVIPVREPDSLRFFNPHKDTDKVNNQRDKLWVDSTPRLIMGIDQHGGRHLIHVVPIDSSVSRLDPSSIRTSSYQRSYRIGDSERMRRTTWQSRNSSSFEKLMEKLLHSLEINENLIETFLFSDKVDEESINDRDNTGRYLSYSDGRMNNGERLEEQTSYSGYRTYGSPQGNQYPLGFYYRMEDQDEELRRYADMTREVNKPAGKYQDQNSMIEYEPYGTSVDGSQDEFLPEADVDRRRRNSSFGKLTDPAFGNRELNRNHTQMDTSDTGVFFAKREVVDNSSDQKLSRIPS